MSPIKFPSYLHFYTSSSLRVSHLDVYSLVSDIIPNTTSSQDRTTNAFANAFFYRSHVLWNSIPLSIRAINFPRRFKSELRAYFWKNLSNLECSSPSNSDNECQCYYFLHTLILSSSPYYITSLFIQLRPHIYVYVYVYILRICLSV